MQIVYVLLVSLSYFINLVSAEIFAEYIDENTYYQKTISFVHTCHSGFAVCLKYNVKYSFIHSKKLTYYRSSFCIQCEMVHLTKGDGLMNQFHNTSFPLELPNEFRCVPSYWNKSPLFIDSFAITAYLKISDLEDRYVDEYIKVNRVRYDLLVPSPYARRNCRELNDVCVNFEHYALQIQYELNINRNRSPLMKSPYIIASEPFLSRSKIGLFLPKFQEDASPDYLYFLRKNKNKLTMSFWIYVHKPCPLSYCSVVTFYNSLTDTFTSPILLLLPSGYMHIQGLTANAKPGMDQAYLTGFKLPFNDWTRIIFTMNDQGWNLALLNEDGDEIGNTDTIRFSKPAEIDILRYVGVLGGSRLYTGFTGLISDVFMWPGINLHSKPAAAAAQMKNFKAFKPYLNNWWSNQGHCYQFWQELSLYRAIWLSKIENQNKICPYKSPLQKQEFLQCTPRIKDMKRPSIYRKLVNILHDDEFLNDDSNWEWSDFRHSQMLSNLADFMNNRTWKHLKIKGVKITNLIEKYLADSFCLGQPDSGFLLATAHYYGMGKVKMNRIKSVSILLANVLQFDDRLSLTALGNLYSSQFVNPHYPYVASVFYDIAADYARSDNEEFDAKDFQIGSGKSSKMFADQIRLSDEDSLKEHTDEDGDLMQWIQHQAHAGESWAKERLGRIFYWGSQGIRRNINQALHYMRQAAQGPNAQPVHHFDYGLTLIQKQDKTNDELEEGKRELEKAASKDEPRAYTALGWLYETRYRDYKKAIEYYRKGAQAGNPDALFNIGVYYHNGVSGILEKNKIEAFKYFQKAASIGQFNAGYLFGQYVMLGIDGHLERNIPLSVKWFKHVAEKSPKLGLYLSEGVRAFRKKQIGKPYSDQQKSVSFLYYFLSAMTGIELSSYNAAVLCEEYPKFAKAHIQKECTWYHYNQSVMRPEYSIYAMSLIKMGDMHWYGCLGNSHDTNAAIEYYIRATKKYEPRAFYNLGYILEHNYSVISANHLETIENIHSDYIDENNEDEIGPINNNPKFTVLASTMYSKCQSLTQNNEHFACTIAKWRMEAKIGWNRYLNVFKLILGLLMFCPVLIYVTRFYQRFQGNFQDLPQRIVITNPDLEQGTENPVTKEPAQPLVNDTLKVRQNPNWDLSSNSGDEI